MSKIALIYLGRKGGAPVFSYEMARGLIENKNDVYAFISSSVENLESWKSLACKSLEIIDTSNSTVGFILATLRFRLLDYPRLKKKYVYSDFDAAYIPMGHLWDDFLISIVGNPRRIDTIHDPIRHSSDKSLKNALITFAEKILTAGVKRQASDDIVILSRVFIDYVANNFKISKEHIHVIPHGIFDFYKKTDNGAIYHYDSCKTNFIFFGRIEGYKGIDVLGKAYQKLCQKYNNISLTVIGSGDFSQYKNLFSTLKNTTVINRWIKDEEVASFFKESEKIILVLPYKDATQSGVIPTAMSFGVPIIASDIGGLTEQIENGVTGYLCRPNDIEALADKMRYVMESDNTSIINNAKEYINSLDWVSLSRQLQNIIESGLV